MESMCTLYLPQTSARIHTTPVTLLNLFVVKPPKFTVICVCEAPNSNICQSVIANCHFSLLITNISMYAHHSCETVKSVYCHDQAQNSLLHIVVKSQILVFVNHSLQMSFFSLSLLSLSSRFFGCV